VSCTNLIICIGLCVDCAAHIAHQFLAEKGKLAPFVISSIVSIGDAVYRNSNLLPWNNEADV
jgi:hypothetical protein